MTNVLVYTSLFPSPRRPLQGLFVSELALALAGIAGVRVVKPVVAHQNTGEILSRTRSFLHGGVIPVEAPLSANVPRFFKGTDARLMALGSRAAFRRACEGWADVVHAHFAYPDAAAAAILASRYALPLVVTVHGSDLNVLAASPARRWRVQRTLRAAAAVIAVARDLGRKVADLGVPEDRIHHVPNGVDLQKFSPGAREEARTRLGLPSRGRLVLAVGSLVPVKAYDRLIRALSDLDPDVRLALAGGGPQRESLEQLASDLGLSGRVRFLGPVPHEALVGCFRAADILAISSHSEGWPTVIPPCSWPLRVRTPGRKSRGATSQSTNRCCASVASRRVRASGRNDARRQSWRHLDTRQFHSVLPPYPASWHPACSASDRCCHVAHC